MSKNAFSGFFVLAVTWMCVAGSMADDGAGGAVSPLELFNQRIMPIFRSSDPSSCVQCHLAAVDLKKYILPSHEGTFLSLRDSGLIDLESPEKSKILTLIKMGEKDLDKGARLIHEKTRQRELEAFSAWIVACCNDRNLRSLPPLDPSAIAGPGRPDAVIRHARKSRVVDSFVRNVWSQRMRCFPCHTPHEIDATNPRQQAALKTRRKLREQYGDELDLRLNIFRETPEETLAYLIQRSSQTPDNELPLLNLQHPRDSLLVRKPLARLPAKDDHGKLKPATNIPPLTHGGGIKMHPDDQSYKSFIAWIQDYANVVNDRYVAVDELPADNWFGSQLMLQLTEAPKKWPVGIPVQLIVHGWNAEAGAFDSSPIAFTQGTVTPKRMVSGSLFLLGQQKDGLAWDSEKPVLPRGKYLIKTYVDWDHRLAQDPTLFLGENELQGQAEIQVNRWREGFRQAKKFSLRGD